METRNAKLLDEACNSYNEAYRDEALYAAWADAPRAANDPALSPPSSVTPLASLRALADALMTRLYACHE
jgi:hypothetical protein